ncbi:MAG: class I SAM-dependent methyltransferase [Bacteroidales bacterium]|nr:class I SAM-dependent methyltransferase [Bacteroidales bacterium]
MALYLQSQLPDEFARWRSIYAATGCQDPNCVAIGPSQASLGPSPSVRPGLARGLDDPAAASDCVMVLDVGCGGGFPGIPLAAVFPNVQFTLCDSIGKKVRVASEVAAALGLHNVECIHSRVEDLPSSRRWDWVVSRAVTSLDNFLPWVRGRYTSGILYLKGGDISEELEACRKKFSVPCGPGKGIAAMPSVSTWSLSSVLADPYYAEKLVVHLK